MIQKITQIDLENEATKQYFVDLFDDTKHPNYVYLRRGCLTFENQRWGFSQEEFYEYFATVIGLRRTQEVLKDMEQDFYKMKTLPFVNT